jgi:glycosyltransferase involved in cell wall biosynthesis
MKNIGIFHYQVGRTDGVSLEIEKWERVLEEMGHTVHLCAGDLGAAEGTLIEEMYHHRPDAERLGYNTFRELRDYADDAAYRAELFGLADVIERKIRDFVAEKGIDFLIPQNVWSVAANPPVSIALARVMRNLQLPALAHNHDFYWERTDGVALTCATAIELADKYLPPRDPLARHVVINSLAQRELLERKGIESTVVPNVFDFDAPPWQPDDYNRDLRARIGLRENDLFILQATRIVARKGIELAVDFVRALDTPERRAILLISSPTPACGKGGATSSWRRYALACPLCCSSTRSTRPTSRTRGFASSPLAPRYRGRTTRGWCKSHPRSSKPPPTKRWNCSPVPGCARRWSSTTFRSAGGATR